MMRKQSTFILPIVMSIIYFIILFTTIGMAIIVSMNLIPISTFAILSEILGYIMIALSPCLFILSLYISIRHMQKTEKERVAYRMLPLWFTLGSEGIGLLLFLLILTHLFIRNTTLVL